MAYLRRTLEPTLRRASRQFPALLLTGPRRAGKTCLLRHAFPEARHVLLEDPEVLARVRADPRGFMEGLRPPVILDEIQNAPELFSWIRARIDAAPRRTGRWFLTGSQEAPLMRGVTESMAGRVAVFDLLPFSLQETPRVSWLRGGFPEVVLRPRAAHDWFRSYVRTYLERDVRAVTDIRDLAVFRRFLALVAARVGQPVNRSDFAAPLGVSVPTITQWLSILEITGQVLLIPPYHQNFGKRLTKSPKLYFSDSGLACHLLGIATERELLRSPFAGPIFEGFVAAELTKLQLHAGRSRQVYFFRDHQGLEVDFVLEQGGERLALVEAKASRTVWPHDAAGLKRVAALAGGRVVETYVVHRAAPGDAAGSALVPGVKAVGLPDLLEALALRP